MRCRDIKDWKNNLERYLGPKFSDEKSTWKPWSKEIQDQFIIGVTQRLDDKSSDEDDIGVNGIKLEIRPLNKPKNDRNIGD